MIATHSVKSLDSRLKQTAIRSKITMPISGLLSSYLLNPLKFYAASSNAANIRVDRAAVEQANADALAVEDLGYILPPIEDGRLKQVLLPYNNDYVALSPVPSLGIMDAINKIHVPFYHWHTICPILAATTNHGDPVAGSYGRIKLIDNAVFDQTNECLLDEKVVLITANCQDMNVSSCYVSTGLPALTGIGGFVHVIERNTGLHLPFGFGIKTISKRGSKLGTNSAKDTATAKKTIPNLILNEININADIAIVLRVKNQDEANFIIERVKTMNRCAGGSLFDVQAAYTNILPSFSWYQADNDSMKVNDFEAMIESQKHGYKFIQSGYAFLENPTHRDKGRAALHAWAEPLFSLIQTGKEPSFFELKNHGHYLNWE